MSKEVRLRDGNTIIEVNDARENGDDYVLLTISKERYDEDAVQVKISSAYAKALGLLLVGE